MKLYAHIGSLPSIENTIHLNCGIKLNVAYTIYTLHTYTMRIYIGTRRYGMFTDVMMEHIMENE